MHTHMHTHAHEHTHSHSHARASIPPSQAELVRADETDANVLADFLAAQQLEDLRKMRTPVA
jgi:hypothetical protein